MKRLSGEGWSNAQGAGYEAGSTVQGGPFRSGYRAYAGIGSRETPADVMALMQRAAAQLEGEGFTLRSGGAQGADSAFEVGASPAMREIYLPWNGFQGKRGGADGYILSERLAAYQQARDLASQFYHSPQRMNERAIGALMSRNSFQIMGQDMESPVEAVLAWTRGGSGSGGTGQALRIAKAKGIPIFDLGNPEVRRVVEQRLEAGEPLFGGVAVQPPAAAAGLPAQGVPFEIVASRGPGVSFDVLGMRQNGRVMATIPVEEGGDPRFVGVSAPGEPGWLGNPFVADDAGGRMTRAEATAAFGDLVRKKAEDPAWRDAFLSLRGKRIGYYKPEESAIHLHELQRWIAEQDGDLAVAGVAGVPAGAGRVQLELALDGGGSPPPPPPPRVTVVAESPEPGPGPGSAPVEEPPLPPREVVENPERKAGDLLPWLLAAGAGGALGLGAGVYSQREDEEELRLR